MPVLFVSDRNVGWPRRMMRRWRVTVRMPTGRTDGQTDRYLTLSAIDAASVIKSVGLFIVRHRTNVVVFGPQSCDCHEPIFARSSKMETVTKGLDSRLANRQFLILTLWHYGAQP